MKYFPIIGIVALLIVATLFFYPKPRITGELDGFIGPNEESLRTEYTCIGISYDFCPDWPDYGCDYLCYGTPVDPHCFIEATANNQQTKTPIACPN